MTRKIMAAVRRLRALEQAAKSKESGIHSKKLKSGSGIFWYEGEALLSFEDAKYDFDGIEGVLNLFSGVPSKNLMTRGLMADSLETLQSVIALALKNQPISNESMAEKVLTKVARASYYKFIGDLQSARDEINKVLGRL